jgi:NAD(P)-dependent dehydrogenase (short-subunit alcohol dehydrogenase family)
VTGAGQGIGHAIAHALASRGATVAVNALHEKSAARTCDELVGKGCKAIAVAADVADETAVRAMIEKVSRELGPVDVLVNNAAASAGLKPFAESTAEEQHAELAKLLGGFHCTRLVCSGMIARRYGRIVNISSIAGRHGMPLRAVYSAANAGLDAFTRALAKELGPYGVTVNSVSPGAIESPRFQARSKDVREATRQAIALQRFGKPEDIANVVLFLASDEGAYLNGAILDVDGGFCGYLPPLRNDP